MQKKEPNRLFLERSEANQLEQYYSDDPLKQAAIRVMLLGGLRIKEAAAVRAGDVIESDAGVYRLRVRSVDAKNSKLRETIIPERVAEQLSTIGNIRERDGELFDVTKRTLRNWVYNAGEALAEETGDDDWNGLKPHDCRRYFCSQLVRQGFAAAEVMAFAGNEHYSTFRDHYWLPSDEVIRKKVEQADF